MKKLYRRSYIDASYQAWFNLARQQIWLPRAILVSDWLMLNKSPLKLLGQIKLNLAGSIYARSSIKHLHLVPTLHRCFLPSLAPFGQAVSEEKIVLTVANQKTELLLVAMFVGQMEAIFVSDWLMLNKSSPLKLLGQMEPNLVGSIYVRYSIKVLHMVPFGQQTWPPRAILFSDWLLLKKSSPQICLTLANQKQKLLLAAIFVGQTERNVETL
jgi:hypothetical protein